jgi:hypothetical protein
MSQLTLEVPHLLGRDEATRRLKDKMAAVYAEYRDKLNDFREEWRDHTLSFGFKALGMGVSGTVSVEPEKISLAANLPMAAMLFRDAIEDRIRQEVGNLLK